MTSDALEETEPASPATNSVTSVMSGVVWAALALTILSGWFTVTRLGFAHDLRVWDVIALRFGEGAVILTPVLFVRKSRLPRHAWREGLLFALLWGAPFIFLVAVGIQLTSITLASSIAPTLMPVFVGIFGWLALDEVPTLLSSTGYACIGVGLSALISFSQTTDTLNLQGVASLVIASAMWAIYTIRFRRSGLTPLEAAALICFWSAILYLPFYLFFGASHLATARWQELLFQSLYQGFLMSVVAIFAFNRAVGSLGSRAATAIIALVPGAATIFAILALNEIPSITAAGAILVIAAGVVLAAGPTRPQALP